MFSLGIVVFELWHPFSTGMERAVLLRELREQRKMPEHWERNHPKVAHLIRWVKGGGRGGGDLTMGIGGPMAMRSQVASTEAGEWQEGRQWGFGGVEGHKRMAAFVSSVGLQTCRPRDFGADMRDRADKTRTLFHLAVLCDSLRCGAYGTFCYGIS